MAMRGVIDQKWRPVFAGALIAHAVFVALAIAMALGFFQRLELLAYDLGVRLRADVNAKDDRIALVLITEKDLARFGWPLSDGILAEALGRIRANGAEAVVMDLFRDLPVGEGRERLDELLANDRGIIWGYQFGGGDSDMIPPPAVLVGTDQAAFNDVVLDEDGPVRRALLFLDDGETVGTSMGLMVALRHLETEGIEPAADDENPQFMRLGRSTFVPVDEDFGGYVGLDAAGYQYILDFADGPAPFETHVFGDLMDGEVGTAELRGKLVFVGTASQSVKDHFETPFSSGGAFDQTYGVILHAHMADQILRRAVDGAPSLEALDDVAEHAWVWVWCVLGAMAGVLVRAPILLTTVIAVGAVLLSGLWYGAFTYYLWIPVVPPMIGWAGGVGLWTAYVSQHERLQRAVMMRLFSSHVSSEVAKEVWRNRDAFLHQGRPRPLRLTATVLFSDIDSFTTVSEGMPPDELMDWLNAYMEEMARLVSIHGGIVDKFIGDAVMAVFGAPLPRDSDEAISEDAENAVRCALAMGEVLQNLNSARTVGPEMRIAIGIHTGDLVAGSLGSSDRMEYTVIGDTVNTAARLEAAAKNLQRGEGQLRDCRIVVGESTWGRLKDGFQGEPIGALSLKGKAEEIKAFRLLG